MRFLQYLQKPDDIFQPMPFFSSGNQEAVPVGRIPERQPDHGYIPTDAELWLWWSDALPFLPKFVFQQILLLSMIISRYHTGGNNAGNQTRRGNARSFCLHCEVCSESQSVLTPTSASASSPSDQQ